MKNQNSSNYFLSVQVVLLVVLGAWSVVDYRRDIKFMVTVLLSVVIVVLALFMQFWVGRRITGGYMTKSDYIHGSKLPVRLYSPVAVESMIDD